MEKKISIKTLYLLFLISFGLVALGVGSTYAMFVATAEINNPISFVSNLSYNSDILDIIEIDIEPDETIISTLNVKNNTSNPLNYSAWYIDGGNDIVAGINSGSPVGSITASGRTSIEVEIRNESTKKVKVILGVTSNSDNVVIGNNMKIIPNERISSTMAVGSHWYQSTVDKSTITKITFAEEYTVTGSETESWPAAVDKDIDGTNDSDIMCYLNGTEVTIVGTGRIFANATSSGMFDVFSNVTSIENLNLLDISKITNMDQMFRNCSSLTELDLSSFGDCKASTTHMMFQDCSSLKEIDLSSFYSPNLRDTKQMFRGCSSLTKLDLGSLNTSKVTTMYAMFGNCNNIKNLNLSNFDTSSLKDADYMFKGCNSLNELDLSIADFSNVTNFTQMLNSVPSSVAIKGNSSLKEWFTTNYSDYADNVVVS